MKSGISLAPAAAIFILLLSSCVQTRQLYAVRQWKGSRVDAHGKLLWHDDRPRVDYDNRDVKQSFADFLASQCSETAMGASLKQLPSASTDPTKSWAEKNPQSSVCISRVAAYAVDQCEIITLHQNEVAAVANAALGALVLGSAATSTAYVISGTKHDRDAAVALNGAVSANNGARSFLPGNQTTPATEMLNTAAPYAQAIGLTDEDMIALSNAGGEDSRMKLAQVHDAVFSRCNANAYGGELPSRAAR